MKKNWIIGIFLLCCSLPLYVQAQALPGTIEVWGEYLFLKPSLDGSFFGLVQETPNANFSDGGNINRLNNPFDFTSGFRIGSQYNFCNNNNAVRADFTYLSTKAHRASSSEGAVAPVDEFLPSGSLFPGNIESHLDLRYYAVDLLFSHPLLECSLPILSLEFGAQFMHLSSRRDVFSITPDPEFPFIIAPESKNSTWALGPQLGIDLSYPLSICHLPQGINFLAKTYGGLLYGRTHTRFNESRFIFIPPTQNINVNNEEHYRFIPFGKIRLGLEYCNPFCCRLPFNIEIGYEFLLYSRAVDWLHFTGDFSGPSVDNYGDFSLQGPYARLTFIF